MITFLQSLPAGNAVRVLLAPPASAVAWRVLRRTDDSFTDQDDAGAAIVYEGSDAALVDIATLTNGTVYYYKPFYQTALGAWSTAASHFCTPAATAQLLFTDPLGLVRDRLELGLKAEVVANRLKHESGHIPTLTAPPSYEGTKFPIVTAHMDMQDRFASGLGEMVAADVQDPVTLEWTEVEGWLTTVQIRVISWVVANADTRIALRKAIAKVLLANLPVFAAHGLSEFSFSQQDVEDTESYAAPLYQTVTSITCLATIAVDAVSAPIADVTLDADLACAA